MAVSTTRASVICSRTGAERSCGRCRWPNKRVASHGQKMSKSIYWETFWQDRSNYYQKQVDTWWLEDATLDHEMGRLLHTFRTTITASQIIRLFTARKDPKRSWPEHILYWSPYATRAVEVPRRRYWTTLSTTRQESSVPC